MRPAPASNIASRTASALSTGTNTTHLSSAGPSESGDSTPSTVTPSASASASDTPGDAESALVCAVKSERPLWISLWTSQPFGVLAATVSTPRKSSGWCASSSPSSGTSAATSGVASTATVTSLTWSAGSPHTKPTESHDCANRGGYASSSTSTMSLSDTLTTGSPQGPQ